jgi:hypothetical protein
MNEQQADHLAPAMHLEMYSSLGVLLKRFPYTVDN